MDHFPNIIFIRTLDIFRFTYHLPSQYKALEDNQQVSSLKKMNSNNSLNEYHSVI